VSVDGDLLAGERQRVGVLGVDVGLAFLPVHCVVREHVGHVVRADERVVHGDELDVVSVERHPRHQAAEPAEAIDPDADFASATTRGGKLGSSASTYNNNNNNNHGTKSVDAEGAMDQFKEASAFSFCSRLV
jgi:hypothetical protein